MKKIFLITLCVAVLSLCASSSFAREMDLLPIVKSEYFSIYGPGDLDVEELLLKLHFNYFLQPDSLLSETVQAPRDILAQTMDALYLEVSDILGIHVYSFHGNIEFYPDQPSLNEAFKRYFDTDFGERSFYLHEKNTIYLSFQDLTLGMIGHEISHAIQSHYFVVPPPVKVQEILAGYVEYSLRKPAREARE